MKKMDVKEDQSFKALLLSEQTLSGLVLCGFVKPAPVQFRAIPFGNCGFGKIFYVNFRCFLVFWTCRFSVKGLRRKI